MALHEIARRAIADADWHLALSLAHYLEERHHLNRVGIDEYLRAHGIDPRDFEELLKEEN